MLVKWHASSSTGIIDCDPKYQQSALEWADYDRLGPWLKHISKRREDWWRYIGANHSNISLWENLSISMPQLAGCKYMKTWKLTHRGQVTPYGDINWFNIGFVTLKAKTLLGLVLDYHDKQLRHRWFQCRSGNLIVTYLAPSHYHQWPLLLTWFNFNPSMDK